MTDRIYTIPAREVVPGMHVANDLVVSIERDGPIVIGRFVKGGFTATENKFVRVTLPGWSPRELLCSCDVIKLSAWKERWRDAACMAPDTHLPDCPVRLLRLRLWPVGATWSEDRKSWLVPIEHQEPWHVDIVSIHDEFFAYDADAQDLLRAAFCEPEVTP